MTSPTSTQALSAAGYSHRPALTWTARTGWLGRRARKLAALRGAL